MTEIYRAIKYLVEPIRELCRMIFFLFYRHEEAKIPSLEGCEIKVAREVPESWSGVKKVVPPPSKWICRD